MDWAKQGSCRKLPTEWFFPEDEIRPEKDPRYVCAKCPVRKECFDHGLLHERYGIWGGYFAYQRKNIRKRRGITLTPYQLFPDEE